MIAILGLFFLLIDCISFGEGGGGSFETGGSRSMGGRSLDEDRGGLESWKIFLDVICVSSQKRLY